MYYEIKLAFITLAYISKIVLNQNAVKIDHDMKEFDTTNKSTRVKRNAGSCK